MATSIPSFLKSSTAVAITAVEFDQIYLAGVYVVLLGLSAYLLLRPSSGEGDPVPESTSESVETLEAELASTSTIAAPTIPPNGTIAMSPANTSQLPESRLASAFRSSFLPTSNPSTIVTRNSPPPRSPSDDVSRSSNAPSDSSFKQSSSDDTAHEIHLEPDVNTELPSSVEARTGSTEIPDIDSMMAEVPATSTFVAVEPSPIVRTEASTSSQVPSEEQPATEIRDATPAVRPSLSSPTLDSASAPPSSPLQEIPVNALRNSITSSSASIISNQSKKSLTSRLTLGRLERKPSWLRTPFTHPSGEKTKSPKEKDAKKSKPPKPAKPSILSGKRLTSTGMDK